jgi:hypothetical protein
MDARLGHHFSTPIVFDDLVPQGADRNPEKLCGASSATTLMGQRLNNEFALDLSNRTPNKASDSFDLLNGKLKRTKSNFPSARKSL